MLVNKSVTFYQNIQEQIAQVINFALIAIRLSHRPELIAGAKIGLDEHGFDMASIRLKAQLNQASCF